MKILIVSATAAEIVGIRQAYKLAEQEFAETKNFDLLVTGVGMTAAAFALGKYLNKKYKAVLNVGIAGSFNHGFLLGDLVNITQDCFAELGAEDHEQFIPVCNLGLGENIFLAEEIYQSNLPKVKAITVNKIHGEIKSIQKAVALFNPDVESMEGAAVFYACQQAGIACMQVRSISNYVEPRNRKNWQIDLAIKNLNQWLINFVSANVQG